MNITRSKLFNIKYIVLIGYILVTIVMIVGMTSIYNNLVEFSEKKVRDENLSELIIVGTTISRLYDIESSQNLLDYQSAQSYFHKYDSILPHVYANLDTLKSLSKDADRITQLDSIKLLLDKKNQNLQKVVVLLDSIKKAPRIIRETSSQFVPKKLNAQVAAYMEKNNLRASPNQNKTDTTVIRKEKKGFFARVRDVFAGDKPDSTIVIEKQSIVGEKEFELVVDTIVNMVRYAERLSFDNQRKFQLMLFEKQADMSNTNSLLTMRVDALLKGIEKEEFDRSIRLLEEKNKMLQKSQHTIYNVSWLALIIALVFGMLFIVAFNIGQKYRRKLEISNERIQHLLASREKLMLSISHDIKAPMSSVLGYIELMYPSVLNDKRKMYLDNMRNSGEHILNLVMNLLDYYKLESGTWVQKKMKFNVADFVDEVSESFRPIARKKNLQYQIKNAVSKNVVSYGDPYMLRQILSNLISNAIKYTPDGSVFVKASILEERETLKLKLSVIDTGKGIDEKDQEVIFKEFEQLTAPASENKIEGSGLGLAITKALLNELNGTISLQSEKGKGSDFTIIVPLAVSSEAQLVESEILSVKNRDLGGLKALLVDDDPIQLTMVSEMLKQKNMRVVTENNPEKVTHILRNQQFDIAFIDIQMPYMNGFTLVQNIRNSGIYGIKNLPIVALSAKSDIRKPDVTNAGFTDFLTKPFSAAQLYAAVSEHVQASATQKEAVPAATHDKGIHALIDFVKDDKQASSQILNSFITEVTANIRGMEKMFSDEKNATAAQLAHKIVPLIQMIGDEKLVILLRKTERQESLSAEEKKRILSSLTTCVQEAQRLKNNIEKGE